MCLFEVDGTQRLATAGSDAVVRIWDVASGALVRTLKARAGLHTAGIEMSRPLHKLFI
ncbi:hypothetical protein GWI34_03800 [Actinomadura sp. DSM 109109]|nr:hypothetical protein [Actinomadura lepetitiana]